MSKKTDAEMLEWDAEVKQILIAEGVPEKYPDWNAAIMAKVIDSEILYELFELGNYEKG